MPTISLQDVNKCYDNSQANAVNNLNLEIADGEFMCLLGPSGCGKTTTLRMIAGLENLSNGDLSLGENLVDSKSSGIFVPPEKRNLGLVFQSYALWPHLTIERNIDFGLRLRNEEKTTRDKKVAEVMKTLGIEQYRGRYPSQLSGGQQQRVALARMLAVNPDILLMDEPLSNLDARLRLEMRTELKRIHSAFNSTIVFVTHDQWEAMALATKIAVMNAGELQQVGTPNEIYERPANRFVAEFVGTPPINMLALTEHHLLNTEVLNYLSRRFESAITSRLTPATLSESAVGMRPERLQISQDRAQVPSDHLCVGGKITSTLPTGGSWILELDVDGQHLHVCTQTPPAYRDGESVFIHIAPSDFHIFDKDGQRITEADDILSSNCAVTYSH